jgi:hypothetical protein
LVEFQRIITKSRINKTIEPSTQFEKADKTTIWEYQEIIIDGINQKIV